MIEVAKTQKTQIDIDSDEIETKLNSKKHMKEVIRVEVLHLFRCFTHTHTPPEWGKLRSRQ